MTLLADFPTWLIILAMVAVLLAIQPGRRMSMGKVRELLTRGAVVIDVRSPAEYKRNSVPNAVNIPLDQIRQEVVRRYPDPSKVLLCYCLSGMRSASAVATLRRLGYQAHNLGSLSRARHLTAGKRRKNQDQG